MIVIGLTGGIATGKSSVGSLLTTREGVSLLSADTIVHDLQKTSEVLEALQARFGAEVIDSEGRLDRSALGKRIFGDEAERTWLEDFLHPRVLREIQARIDARRSSSEPGFAAVVEVPLLYEVDFPLERDIDVLVACAPGTQLQRLQARSRLDLKSAQERIAAQLPISEKLCRADHVIWNEGSRTLLERQTTLFADLIFTLDS